MTDSPASLKMKTHTMAQYIRQIESQADVELAALVMEGQEGLNAWRTWAMIKQLCVTALIAYRDGNEENADSEPQSPKD